MYPILSNAKCPLTLIKVDKTQVSAMESTWHNENLNYLSEVGRRRNNCCTFYILEEISKPLGSEIGNVEINTLKYLPTREINSFFGSLKIIYGEGRGVSPRSVLSILCFVQANVKIEFALILFSYSSSTSRSSTGNHSLAYFSHVLLKKRSILHP